MPETMIQNSFSNGSVVSRARKIGFSMARLNPSRLLIIFIIWVFFAELTDVFFIHDITFSSSVIEGLVDTLLLLTFISPSYFLFYLPLKAHWQQELKARDEVKLLNQRLLKAEEDERQRLAMVLHDHFGQFVTTLQGRVGKIQRQLDQKDTASLEDCAFLEETIWQMGHDIRKFTTDLRPDMIDDLGLVETLKWYVGELAKQQSTLEFDYQAVGIKQRLPEAIEITLYRVCQESLNNIIKHAEARHVSIKLTSSHPWIILTIRDDGKGLPNTEEVNGVNRSNSFGLLGMRERLAAVGGVLEISSKSGERTTIRAMIPIQEACA